MAYDGESDSLFEVSGDDITTQLPDLSGMTLEQLGATADPRIIAAAERVVQQVLATGPDDGHC
ncbi:MAG: hypothetical protein ABWY71_00525 [Candidatus Saccharimonadales bacterium]